MEPAGSIPTIRSRTENTLVVVVLHTSEVTFVVVACLIGIRALAVDSSTRKFLVVIREHLGFACAEDVVTVVVVFMSEHNTDVMYVGNICRIVENLLEVAAPCAAVPFLYSTASGIKLSVISVVHVCRT